MLLRFPSAVRSARSVRSRSRMSRRSSSFAVESCSERTRIVSSSCSWCSRSASSASFRRLMLSARTAFRTPRRIRAPAPGENQVPVAGVRRLGEVDHGAPCRETGGRDPPPDELEVVEQVPPREVPHDGDRRRVLSAKNPQRDLPGRLSLVEAARELPAHEAEPEVEVPRAVHGDVRGLGYEPDALVVPEDPAHRVPGIEGEEDEARGRERPEPLEELLHRQAVERLERHPLPDGPISASRSLTARPVSVSSFTT